MLEVCYIPTDQVFQLNNQYDNFILLIQLKFNVLLPFCVYLVSVTLGVLALSATKWHQQSDTKSI